MVIYGIIAVFIIIIILIAAWGPQRCERVQEQEEISEMVEEKIPDISEIRKLSEERRVANEKRRAEQLENVAAYYYTKILYAIKAAASNGNRRLEYYFCTSELELFEFFLKKYAPQLEKSGYHLSDYSQVRKGANEGKTLVISW